MQRKAVKAILLELQEMGFQKVTAGYFSENKASYHVYEKVWNDADSNNTDEEEYRGERHLCRYCEIHFKKD